MKEELYMLNQFDFLKDLNVDQDVIQRLTIILRRVIEGNSEVYRTPLAKDKEPKQILAEMDSSFSDAVTRLPKALADLEFNNRLKFGPRSIAKPWIDRVESVKSYFDSSSSASNRYSDLLKFVPKDKSILRPLELRKASGFLKNNTSSGLPFLRKKGGIKERVLGDFDRLLSRKDPCVLFTRTQEQGKTRAVWGFPMADTLNEMRYYRPLLDYQRKLSFRGALVGPEEVNNRMTHLINSAKINDHTLISIDFSAYDASVKYGLQDAAFAYIKSLYQKKYSTDLDYILDRFSSIGLITPDGVMNGRHGVPSGSTFTNEVDSIVQWQVACSSGLDVGSSCQIQGDDGVYAISEDGIQPLLNNFKKFGLNVNIDKSYVEKDFAVFLQNLYHTDLRHNGIICGIYPIYRALNRLIFQESWDDFEDYGMSGADYYSLRSISILENCKYHPLFEDFVRFICKLDKYNLQVSLKGITQYVEMMSNKLGTEGLFTNQYGDNVKGIKSFETFKVIRKIKG